MRIGSGTWRLLTTGLLLASTLARAEPPMIFQHLGSQEGLPQNTVMQTLQDSQGFIWIATEDGLVRYDGYNTRRYARERGNNDSLPANYVWGIAEDRSGDLWLALKDAGLARWNRRTDRFTSFRHDPARRDSLASDALRALAIDRRGHVWLGTTGSGLDDFDPATGSFRHYAHDPARADSLSSDVVTALWQEPDGQIWVGTDDGLNRLLPASGTFRRYRAAAGNPHALSSNRIASIRTDQRGRLWVATFDGGLDLLERASETFSSYRAQAADPGSLPSDEVRALLEDRGGRLWVGTSAGLALHDDRTDRFTRFTHDPTDPTTLRDDYVMSLFEDRGGLLWAGTRGGGVSRWNPRTWSLGHHRPAGFDGALINAFAEDQGGRLWIATLKGLGRFDPAAGAWTGLEQAAGAGRRLADPRVMTLLMDRHGDLWIGSIAGGLSRLSSAGTLDTWRAEPANPNALGANGIMALLEHSGGRLWIGTFGSGVNILDPVSGRVQRVPHDPHDPRSLSGPRATALAEDRDGNVWVGTENGGLNLLRADGSVAAVFQHRPGDLGTLSANTVYALRIDGRGRVWIGTDGGGLDLVVGSAAQPDKIQFKNLSERDGLPSDVVYGIETDARGALWLSGNAGLTRYDPETGHVRQFHREHGLQGEEFAFGSHFRTRAGLLAFGGANGFNLFDPGRVTETAAVPQLVLTSVEVLNKPARTPLPYPLLERLALDYRDGMVSFEFAALDYASPSANRYAYRLRGFDPDWVEMRQRRRVTYTNLAAGSYVLEVKAANSDGAWSPVAIHLPVSVAPAPWRTWWAMLCYAAAVALLLYGAHRQQRRKLAEAAEGSRRLEAQVAQRTAELRDRNAELDRVNQVKSDFLARMSHEIRSPMNGVIGTLELLQRTPQSVQQAQLTTTIKASAQSLLRILNDILDLSKVEAGKLSLEATPFDLAALVEETVQLFAPQAEAKHLELIVSPAPELDRLVVGDALRMQQILLNLLGNAIKFTERGEVVVTATAGAAGAAGANELAVTIAIRDTGIGMTPEALARVFEPFAQADESTTRRYGGTGLGLAICRELAALMGTTIQVDSAPGRGSQFTVQLRLPAGEPIVRADAGRLQGLRAAVASRRPALVEAIIRHGRAAGVAIDALPSDVAVAAYPGAAATPSPPLDVLVVDADSFAAELPAIAQRGAAAGQPALVIACSADPVLRAQLAASGATAPVVGKPVRRAELLDALARATGRRAAPPAGAPAPTAVPHVQAHVLVAEDNPVNQVVTEGFLTEIGCSVTCVADGRAAVTHASSAAFDLILMDLQMPGMDGLAATALIRKAESLAGGRHTPIVAVTANASAVHRASCLAAGMDDFLGKPLLLEDLRAVLARWLPEHAQPASAARPKPPAASRPAVSGPLDADMIAGIRCMSRPGAASLFPRLVTLFATNSRRQLEELRAAIGQGDLAGATAISHALKGGAGNIGAAALAGAARELEAACAARDSAAVARLLEELAALQSSTVAALEAEALKESA
jgi:signal transduction histidine kinase/ligand-binding sensor domain-containing protein/CheY-like chemotaxis protein/HPt (histidine-containing phosphotransfer) domain-containing protein